MSANVAIKYAECCNLNRLNVKLKQIYNVSFPCLWLKGERIASRVSYYLDVKLSESERRGVVGECVFALRHQKKSFGCVEMWLQGCQQGLPKYKQVQAF